MAGTDAAGTWVGQPLPRLEDEALPAAIANAVADALGRHEVELPLTPPQVWRLLGSGP
jgi:hypothetical protein